MKKFLMYVIIVVTCLFLGFTIYYLTQNNENIYITISKEESIYRNKGESILLDSLLTWTKPYKTTTISISSADTNVVTYDENTKRFDCIGGGMTAITITPSNENFGPFIFEIYVGDGTIDNPYVIDSVEDLALIGNDPEHIFELSNSYLLVSDLDLKSYNNGVWLPLGKLTGNFNGGSHVIYNMNIVGNATDAGLFSAIDTNSMVENVKFSNAVIDGNFENVGVVAGINNGIVGKCDIMSANITNTSTQGNTGAIVGANLFTTTSALVNMCSANANITASSNAGGLVGKNVSSIILNSRAICSLTSGAKAANLGGLVGYLSSTYDKTSATYYASAIKNSYVVVEAKNGDGQFGAIVSTNNEDSYTGQLVYNTYIGCIYTSETGVEISSVANGTNVLTNDAKKNLIYKTKTELLQKSNYNGYNFENVWILDTNEMAKLNFLGSYETFNVVAVGKEIKSTEMPFIDFLNHVRENPDNTVTYRICNNTTLDLNGEYWQTIAPLQTRPMRASIIVDDGVSCVITNFKLKEENSSFFGYISGNTVVKGLTFENKIVVESCTAKASAIVATSLMNGATLQDIKVNNYESITTSANNAGIICGVNKGTIKNCLVNCETLCDFSVTRSNALLSVGCIAGLNEGLIDTTSACGVKVRILSTTEKGGINLGGIAGTSTSNIINSYVTDISCDTSASGSIYAGGIVGYTTATTSVVDKCYVSSINIKLSNGDAYLAGIVGYLSAGVTVKGCFYDVSVLEASNVGGLVGISYGTIYSCYVGQGQLIGYKVGGLATLTYGKMTDCYVLADLKSKGSSGVLCGMTYFVGPNCYIEHCFINATYSGDGKYFAESQSEFRTAAIVQWFSNISNPTSWGPVKNNIVLVNNGAKVQASTIFGNREGWIDATLSECKGEIGNYAVFKDKAGFDPTVWEFSGEDFPTLIYIAKQD